MPEELTAIAGIAVTLLFWFWVDLARAFWRWMKGEE